MSEFYKGIHQAILAEEPHVTDPIAREDNIFYRLGELVDENALTEQESWECWTQYIESVRPDVRVVHLGRTVSGAFYE